MFNRGGFPGQMPMGHSPMNQPGMSHPGINMSGMNVSGMNMPGMGMTPMNQPNMNLSGMNHPGMNHQLMGHSGMNHPNIGLSGMNQPGMNNMNQPNMNNMNQPNMNLNPMNHPNMNQGGGMGFLPEMKSQAFGMRPMDTPGSFVGGNADPMGMKGMPIRSPMQMSSDRHMAPQALPQRFASPNVPVHQGQPRMPAQSQEIPSILNMVLTHPSDRMVGNSKAPLQEPAHLMKKKRWEENVNVFGSVGQDMGMKSVPSGSSREASNPQSRYTNESASSILESFGLSNEDLEELSRYPDDQLTPSNMPSILRDIRLRKMNRTTSGPDQAAGRRPGSEPVPSKVIDYGHSSKYQFNNPVKPAQSYNSPRNEQKPPPVPKETVTVVHTNPEMTPDTGMDNKIPTISGSRKHVWSSSKPDRSNNKTLVGKGAKAPVNVSVSVTDENPVLSIQPDVTTKPNVTPVQTELTPAAPVVTSVSQVTYQQPTETPAAGKNKWVPVSPKEEVQKMKMPTPSMMNDYYAASPRIFPHICSLCNVECRHLKDWIKHQNNLSHIESCRNLRQKYPDWNPQVLSSGRNENKKDEPTSHKSESKSVSPRRSRRSGSRHNSRSRSPRSSGRRSRSRTPRRSRHSPRRSRSPRPRSPRRYRRSSRSGSPDKRAVDAAVKSFIEAIKPKAGDKSKSLKTSGSGKKPSTSNVRSKKPVSSAPPKKPGSSASKAGSTSSSSSSSKKPGSNSNSSNNKPSSSNAARKPSSGSSSSKPVVSTAAKKTTPSVSTGKKPQPSKPPAEEHPPSSPTEEAHSLSNKFTSRNNTRKIVHVTDLPDSGYTDQDILKIVQPFGRVCDILIVRSKNEAFLETNFREAAAAVVKYSETTPIMINNKRVTLSLPGLTKKPVSAEKAKTLEEEPAKAPAETAAPEKEGEDKKSQEPSKHDLEVPPGFIKSYMLDDPPLKQNEKCVILISNLPEAQYTVDEITNLAKPFGGVNDVLLVANHRKAYLELTSRSSVDSMIKFYGVFPTYLSGNLLSICVAQRYKDLKNEDLIFADLIEQSSYKITPTIYEKFVHLTDLPEKDVEDFEIIRVGRRFGRVEHHVYFSNKKKAILHLHSASAAKAMFSFLTQYPCSIADNVVQCSLPSKTELSEDEYISYIEEDKPSTDNNLEKAASEVAETKEPDKKEEEPSQPKDKGSNEPNKDEKPSQPKEKVSKEPNKDEKPSQPKEPNKDEKPSQPKDKGSKEPNKKDEKPSQPKEKVSKESNKDEKPSQPKEKGSKEPSKKDEKPSQPKDKGFKEPNKKDEKPSQPKDKGSKEPNKKDEKPSQLKDKWSKEPNKRDEKPSQHKYKWSKEPNKKNEKPSHPKDKWSKEPNKKDEKPSQPKDKGSKEPNKKDETSSQPKDKGSKEPNKKEEKPSQPKGKESEVGPVHSSPASQSKMDVDTAECEGASEPSQSVESEKTSGQASADHPSVELVPSPCMAVTTEDDDDNNDDEDEEAAEAPEAPDTSHVCIQAEPEVKHPEPQPVSQPQVSDDLDVLVSVESDEEESEEQHSFILSTKQGTQPQTVTDMAKLLDTKTSADKEPSGSSESEGKGVTKDAQNTVGTADEGSNKETPKHGKEKHGHHVPTKGRDEVVTTEATETSDVSMVRTTKYNAQKGEISVTVTLDNQKSSSKTESRKRTSRERGSSSHESSTPRSSSNRSSPADSASKSGSSFSQKKTTGKYSSSQPERDSKDTRSRERDARSSSRWEERMRGSSSRYSRSSKSNNRSPRSKEEDEETFPFNLDEFVTVDEIVEDHVDSVTSAEAEEEKPDAARKGKRKENDPLPSDTKKSRLTSTASHKQSFVTLDEVGAEEENAADQENQAESAKPLVTTLDEEHTEDGPPASAKDEQMLMTLDEISDDDDAQNSSTVQQSSKVPEVLTKDQLLTLDEVNEEEEEHTTSTKPQEAVETKLLEDTKDTEVKEKDIGKEPEDKHKPDVQQDAPTNGDRGGHSEQTLLTLDEVKAEDDEMSFADIEHKFLTVDEIGEEEEESEKKAESKPSDTKESSKAEPKSTVKRGRPRKRPLPQSAEDDKGSSVQTPPDTSKGDAVEKSPAKPSQASEGEANRVQGSTSAPPNKTESADGKPNADTSAKKAKLETPPAEKTKLAPYNSGTPVGLEFLVPKTGYFCELCSLFYMDDSSKLKHCRSLRHYQAVEKHLAKLEAASEGKSSST